ncbi:MAG: hypothetical protein ABSC25_26480 [Roseiarcus sp.]
MDCVVKVAGRTVAMRRVPVTITGATMPLRTPLVRFDFFKTTRNSKFEIVRKDLSICST